MEAVKERLIGAITIMSSDEAVSLWEYITRSHTWRDSLKTVEEDDPSPEETEILNAYERGEERYQPFISHSELKKELGL